MGSPLSLVGCLFFFTAVRTVVIIFFQGFSEYVIPKEGPGTDEGGTAGADARTSEGAAGCLSPTFKANSDRQIP